MRILIIASMAVMLSLTGCKTLTGGGCGHQKYVKCVKSAAEGCVTDCTNVCS